MASKGTKGLNLTELVQTRISPRAAALLQKRAQKIGIKPSTLVRTLIYKSLGLAP